MSLNKAKLKSFYENPPKEPIMKVLGRYREKIGENKKIIRLQGELINELAARLTKLEEKVK